VSNDQIIGGIGALIFYGACHYMMHYYWKKRHRD